MANCPTHPERLVFSNLLTMKKSILILVCPAWQYSYATNWYVANTTSGTDAGTQANPWKGLSSLNSHQACINPGDFVALNRGDEFAGSLLNITRSGTALNPITFGAYGTGANPVLKGNGTTLGAIFYVNNQSYLIFRDMWIIDQSIDTTLTGAARNHISKIEIAFYFDNGTNHCKIINCKASAIGLLGFFPITSDNNTIDSCYVNDLTMIVNTDDGGQPGNDDDYGANLFVIYSKNNIITHNTSIRCYAQSFDYTFDGGNDIIASSPGAADSNFICYNKFFDCLGVLEFTGTITGTTFAYNNVINCGEAILFQNSGNAISIYNNNFIGTTTPRSGASNYLIKNSATISFKNNAVWLVNGLHVANPTAGITHQNNFYHTAGGSVVDYTLSGSEATTALNMWTGQAGAAEAWDYTPMATGALINSGQNLGYTLDYAGRAVSDPPESGAYEYVTPVTGCAGCIISFHHFK